jgi:predicted MPP superfamily phosphohydrolase
MPIAVLFLTLLGHVLLWVGVINRIHGFGARRRLVKKISLLCFACMAAIPIVWIVWVVKQRGSVSEVFDWRPGSLAAGAYVVACWIALVATLVRMILLRFVGPPSIVRFHRIRKIAIEAVDSSIPHGDRRPKKDHHFVAGLPGNEILSLELSEWMLDMPRLSRALDRLSIVHLSDLHFTGRIGKSYFREVVRVCNGLEPDLVAITGDLVDDPACIDWIPELLGPLAAQFGVYFVLGNHDVLIDVDTLRRTLVGSGLIDLGGRWMEVDVRGDSVILAGNELPWIGPAANLADCPARNADGGPLRIALTHTPDQLSWARTHDVDLLLAGHTHGGQIRIPSLGAIFSPTFGGVRHVSGVFDCEPTILHVSRGISARWPIRWNCPPEMAMLRLRKG